MIAKPTGDDPVPDTPVHDNVMHPLAQPVGTTLDRYIMQRQSAFAYATGDLSQLLRDIALAGKIIHREVNRAGLIDLTGGIGSQNIQGENHRTAESTEARCDRQHLLQARPDQRG